MLKKIWSFLTTSWQAHQLLDRWKGWRWHNISLLIGSLIVFAFFVRTQLAHEIFEHFRSFSYIGVFLAGLFSPSTFTVVPAYTLLFGFANDLNPYLTAITAGIGAMLGDYIIYHYLKDKVFEELEPLVAYFRNEKIVALFHTPYFAWLLPIIGMFVIASPLPDEVGVSLLGASRLKRRDFLLVTLVINTVGILAVVLSARLI